MNNRVYYGEYSLMHWVELLLKGNIVLPDYQRYFVWSEKKTANLIETFKIRQFVPPVTIGSFHDLGANQNLILDGQQRLTSILLAYLGLYPDEVTYKKALEQFANENDDPNESEEQLDNIYEWTFSRLTDKGKTKEAILSNSIEGNYKRVDYHINDDFFKNTFLGFSYLVPNNEDERLQQKFYSSVFRNINIQGVALLPQESRASLYFLDKTLAGLFSPEFMNSFEIMNSGRGSKVDFVKYLSLLSQYELDESEAKVARGYKTQMEKYYEEYIYSVVGETSSELFKAFAAIFPGKEYAARFDKLKLTIELLDLPRRFTSIIDADIYLFGLIYIVAFRNKSISTHKIADLKSQLKAKVEYCRGDSDHTKAPASLKYLRQRIESSISIYRRSEDA